MWTNVFLDTADEDFTRTVTSPIDLTDWSSRPSEVDVDSRVWASNDNSKNRKTFEQINEGDYIFIYRVDQGHYCGAGIIKSTHETDWFAENFWGEKNENRRLAYILSEFNEHEMSVKEMNSLLGYHRIYHPHGLQRVVDGHEKHDAISKFGLK